VVSLKIFQVCYSLSPLQLVIISWCRDESNVRQLVIENLTNLTIMRGLQWELISEIYGVSLSIKEDADTGTTSIKVEGNITEPAAKIFEFLSHPNNRKEWDPFYDSSANVRTIDESNSIIHIRLKSSANDSSIRVHFFLSFSRLPSSKCRLVPHRTTWCLPPGVTPPPSPQVT